MLDTFIIEQIRRREEQDRNRAHDDNRLQLPVPFRYDEPARGSQDRSQDDELPQRAPGGGNRDRGVVVIDM